MSPRHLLRLWTSRLWAHGVRMCLPLVILPALEPLPLRGQVEGSESVVRGRVVEHETGVSLGGAAVSLAAGAPGTRGLGTRVADSEGRFLFRQVPPGTYRLIVTLIGYRDLQDTLNVELDSDLDLVLPMSISPIELEPLVVVTERWSSSAMRGFEDRRRAGFGTFFDREDIERRQPGLFSDLLRTVPGASVVRRNPFSSTVRLRGGCRPALWVDGMELITEEGMDEILPTMDLEAVEVYHTASVPVQFGSSNCGAIVAWTRRGEPSVGGWDFWRKFAFAGVLTGLALLLIR